MCIIALDETAVPNTLSPFEMKRSADAKEAARWLLNQTPATDSSSSKAPTLENVLQRLSNTPDYTGAKQTARSLAVEFFPQTISNVQGNLVQAVGTTVHMYLGEQRPAPMPADASV